MNKAYFIGIGGIGMSAIARYFHKQGIEIHGYDKTETELTKKLAAEGMNIHYQEAVDTIPKNIDLVVFTPAVPSSHKELQHFRANGYLVKKRAEVLGLISQSKKTIAIAGTHGKTTTTSILTHLLKVGGVDCTAFLGGIARNFGANYVEGESDWLVVEADEYDRSFLHLSPNIAVILSADPDHLDIYGSHENMLETGFKAFAKKIEPEGFLFLKSKAGNAQTILPFKESEEQELANIKIQISSFGLEKGTYHATNIRVENGYFVFDFESPIENIKDILFSLPGNHNVENASAAIAVAQQLGVTGKAVKKALASFKGIKRRFEIIYRNDTQLYIDDYAHHPRELQAAIQAARMLQTGKKLTGIFQPHLYSRTLDFAEGFAKSLEALDEIILLDIYPARELPIEGVSSKIIFDKIKNKNKTLVTKSTLMEHLKKGSIEVLMTLGAGDIDTFVPKIKDYLIEQTYM